MTYTPTTPNAGDIIAVTQPFIRDNFTVLNDVFDIDHVNYTAASDNGKHKKSTYLDQSAGIPTSSAGEVSVYSFTTGGISNLRYRRDNLATEFTLNPIRAFAYVTGTGAPGNQTLTNSFNVSSVNRTASTTWDVTLANPMGSADYAVVSTIQNNSPGSVVSFVTITSSTLFTLTLAGPNVGAAGLKLSFMTLEA